MSATVVCHGVPSGLTLTASVYPDGSDTAAGTALACTEETHRKTTYTFAATGLSGLHLVHLLSGSNVVWVGWAVLAAGGTIEASDSRDGALTRAITDKLDTALEADGPVYRYTANALEQAPAGGGGSGSTTVESFSAGAIAQLAGLKITLRSPTLRGRVFDPPVIRGRDYSASDNNSIDIDVDGWPDLTGTVVLKGVLRDGKGNAVASLQWSGNVVNAGAATQTLRFEPSATETSVQAGTWEAEAVVTLSGSGRVVSPAGVFLLPIIGAG